MVIVSFAWRLASCPSERHSAYFRLAPLAARQLDLFALGCPAGQVRGSTTTDASSRCSPRVVPVAPGAAGSVLACPPRDPDVPLYHQSQLDIAPRPLRLFAFSSSCPPCSVRSARADPRFLLSWPMASIGVSPTHLPLARGLIYQLLKRALPTLPTGVLGTSSPCRARHRSAPSATSCGKAAPPTKNSIACGAGQPYAHRVRI